MARLFWEQYQAHHVLRFLFLKNGHMRLILLLFLALTTFASAGGSVAFFGMHMTDSSSQKTAASTLTPSQIDPAELERLKLVEAMAAEWFVAEGFDLLDLAPVADDLDRVSNPANCYGCDVRMAKKLGADFILVGELNKISDALLSINLQLRDGETGRLVKAGATSIRGNTDDTWKRGMRYILKNSIFREETK
ncbi:MAG: DUF3280 domain-containing protein [Pseudomonadota bacterium]